MCSSDLKFWKIFLDKSRICITASERFIFQNFILEVDIRLNSLDDHLAKGALHLGNSRFTVFIEKYFPEYVK